MRVLVILLVFFIAVNFSVGDDSSKAKKAQNEAKAIIQKLKSQAVSKGNKLKGKINAQISKYLNEMKKVENTIYAQYKKVGVEGQIVGAIFKGNISAYLDANQKGQFMNPTAQKALADNALVNLRGIVIDPVLGDIHNLTTAINKNPANYDCFHSQKKAIQSIADNLVKQVAVRIDSDTTTLKANMTSLVAQIEALRKKVVGEVKACGKNQTCATTYVSFMILSMTFFN